MAACKRRPGPGVHAGGRIEMRPMATPREPEAQPALLLPPGLARRAFLRDDQKNEARLSPGFE
jgi:hypothetical protein